MHACPTEKLILASILPTIILYLLAQLFNNWDHIIMVDHQRENFCLGALLICISISPAPGSCKRAVVIACVVLVTVKQ